jgi:hypothetical protein
VGHSDPFGARSPPLNRRRFPGPPAVAGATAAVAAAAVAMAATVAAAMAATVAAAAVAAFAAAVARGARCCASRSESTLPRLRVGPGSRRRPATRRWRSSHTPWQQRMLDPGPGEW